MGSNKKTTMAKLNREQRMRDRKALKALRREERKNAEGPDSTIGEPHQGLTPEEIAAVLPPVEETLR
jgi:hypothetical protein